MKSSIKEYTTNKRERPFAENHTLHVTMRSEIAHGDLSLRSSRNYPIVCEYIRRMAARFDIRVLHFAVESTHLHLVILAQTRAHLSGFLSALAGAIARAVKRSSSRELAEIPFWSARPYSRILSWGRELRNVLNYVERNVLEANRVIPFIERSASPSVGLNFRIRTSFEARSGQLALPIL